MAIRIFSLGKYLNMYNLAASKIRGLDPAKAKSFDMSATVFTIFGLMPSHFSLLGYKLEDFPNIIIGSIIRIHHMAIQIYQGFRNGRVFDARSVKVVGHCENVVNDKDVQALNKRDKTKIEELKKWWKREGKEKNSQSQELIDNQNLLEFCSITSSTKVLNIACTVLEQISTKIIRCKILRVTDNTKSKLPMTYQEEDGSTLKSRLDSDIHDIFVKEHLELLRLAKPGKKIMLQGLQCVSTESANAYQLIIDSEVKADCKIISSLNQEAQKQIHESLEDSELDRMIARAIKPQSTEEDSSHDVSNNNTTEKRIDSDVANLENRCVGSKNNSQEKAVNSENFVPTDEIPIFPVNAGSLILTPRDSTDDSLDASKNDQINDNADRHEENIEADEIASDQDHALLDKFKNPSMIANISFENLIQLENSICGSAQICKEPSNDNASKIDNLLPDSMQVLTGSQEQESVLDEMLPPNFHNESDALAPTIRSPSPESRNTFAIRTLSNYPLISSVSDVKNKKASERFRIVGYVKSIKPNILARGRDNLILLHCLCTECCNSTPVLKVDQFKDNGKNIARSPTCATCKVNMEFYLNLKLVISDFEFSQPLQLSDSSDDNECVLSLTGVHADHLFGVSAHNFFFSKETQDKVIQHLRNILNQRVELSVVVVEASLKRQYEIFDSYAVDYEVN